MSWQDLPERAQEVAYVLSLFAVAPIPWGLVRDCFTWDEEELEDVRDRTLRRRSLLQRLDKGIYQLHPLLREFMRDKLEEFPNAEILKYRE